MREIITIHAGKCGIKLGDSVWELFCLEQGIQTDGTLCKEFEDPHSINSLTPFYQETENGRKVPRNIYIDADFETID
jgi:tubulin alpha